MNTTVLPPPPTTKRQHPQAVATSDPGARWATTPTGDRCPDPCRGVLLSVVGTNLLVCFSCSRDFYLVAAQ